MLYIDGGNAAGSAAVFDTVVKHALDLLPGAAGGKQSVVDLCKNVFKFHF